MHNAPAVSDEGGRALVAAARAAAAARLGAPHEPHPRALPDAHAGVFVTITMRGQLRGCIGSLDFERRVSESVQEAAVSAATADPRFEPMHAAELAHASFEVTVLSPPEPLGGRRADYASQVRIGRDGLIVRRAPASGLLLPQVPVEYGWGAEEFLDQTCEKAGLERGAWREEGTEVMRFSGTIFAEDSPHGTVSRR